METQCSPKVKWINNFWLKKWTTHMALSITVRFDPYPLTFNVNLFSGRTDRCERLSMFWILFCSRAQQSQHLANEHHIIENVKDPIVSPTLWWNVASWGKLICGRSHNNQLLYNEQSFMPVMHRVGCRENMTQCIFLQLKSFMEKNTLKALRYSSCEPWTFLKRSPLHSSSSLSTFGREESVRALEPSTQLPRDG